MRKVELLGKLRGRVARGRRIRKEWEEKYRVVSLEEAFSDGPAGFGSEDRDWDEQPDIPINRFLPTILSQLPSLFFQAPTFLVDVIDKAPQQPQVDRARMGEGLLASIANQDDQLEDSSKLALLQAFFRFGVLKDEYRPKMEPNPRRGEPLYERNQAGDPIRDETTGLARQATDDDGNPLIEPAEVLTDEVFGFTWVDASRLILPDNGPDEKKWEWIAEEITISLEEAKEEERWPAHLRSQLTANSSDDYDHDDADDRAIILQGDEMEFDVKEEPRFTYIEMWDIRKKRRYMWAAGQVGGVEILFDKPYPDGIEDHPYAILRVIKNVGPKPSPYPIPITAHWYNLAKEHEIRRNQQMNGARRSARKVFYDQSTFRDAQNAQKALQSNKDMEGVEVSDTTRLPIVQADEPLPGIIAQDLAALQSEWIEAVGLPSSAAGRSLNSAKEAGIQAQTLDIRESDMRREISKWMAKAGKKMLQLLRANLTLEVYAKIRSFDDSEFKKYLAYAFDPQASEQLAMSPSLRQTFLDRFGQSEWMAVTRDEINFEADVTVAPGSVRSRTIEAERQQILEFMQIIGAYPTLMQSRELMLLISELFEFVPAQLVDEVVALGEKMNQIEQMKAGRYQGQDQGAAGQAAVQGASNGVSPAGAGAAAPQQARFLQQAFMGG
jgi:hypothetical protein